MLSGRCRRLPATRRAEPVYSHLACGIQMTTWSTPENGKKTITTHLHFRYGDRASSIPLSCREELLKDDFGHVGTPTKVKGDRLLPIHRTITRNDKLPVTYISKTRFHIPSDGIYRMPCQRKYLQRHCRSTLHNRALAFAERSLLHPTEKRDLLVTQQHNPPKRL